jgi:hypothetical protein
MKKILALALPLLLAAASVRADLVWYEGFQYTNGSITTNSLGVWARESGSAPAPGDMYVVNSNLQVSATGGTVSRQDDCDRLFAVTSGSPYTNHVQLIYASFTVICTNLPNAGGSYFGSFYSTAKGYCGRVQAFTTNSVLPNTWRLGVTANGAAANPLDGGFPVDLALNTPYQVVEELDPITLDAVSIWVNPVDLTDTGMSGSDPKYTSSDSIGFQTTNQVNSYAFRQASSFGNSFFLITNLTIATTFPEAATNVWGTNAVAPVIVYQPVGATNFPTANVSIGAVADGQGLGSLTYQWQVCATPDNASPSYVSNPNGNSNILSVDTSSAGTNYYSLVVTTPYGLSVTSAVATVAIVDGPYPPQFVVKPASQSAYRGQTVTFSTSVIAPPSGDPVTYTWYSNNVAVYTQNDNSRSSSYTLNNVLTNFSATYKVAVSNNYGGVVSGNAVLSVSNPPVVTIAYLRHLVSPTTYLPTNAPSIPYQVTGIVTTLTNITSGDTSSYYLQDGTAGINIFVTGGSTFRPALGDVVTFTGVLSSYATGLELYADATSGSVFPYTSFTDLSNNIAGLPAPQSIPYTILNNASNANYNLGGRYVQITDVYFGALGGTTISNDAVNQTVVITNSAGQTFNLFFPAAYDLDVAGQTLPSYAYTVNGIVYSANSIVTNTLVVTRFADINSTVPLPIPLTVVNSGGTLTFNWSTGANAAGFSLQSSDVVTGPYTTIDGATPGFTTNTLSAPTLFFRLYHP